MISCTLFEISKIINGKLIGNNKSIDNISIDSRNIKKNCLFIAFIGKNFNAHRFIYNAIQNGAVAILVSKYVNISISQIIVNNVNDSFFCIGKLIRKKSKACLIAITGSCGKTSVKEMTVSILNNIGKVTYTTENKNNIIGISITLCNIEITDNFVVIEVGTDGLHQISNFIDLIKPNIILINNLFISHFLKLKSYKNLVHAKGEILETFSKYNRIILNFDNNNWNYWRFISFCKFPLFFSLNKLNKVDFYTSDIHLNSFKSNFVINSPIGKKKIYLNIPGTHNIYNSIAASAISISVGANLDNIYEGLLKINSIKHRLQPLFINKSKIILDDTYNANFGSFMSSFNVLLNIDSYKVIVISDIYELGDSEIFLHKKIGSLIKKLNINKILSFGKLSYFITLSNSNGEHYLNKNNLINRIINLLLRYNKITILIKGSRNNKLDELINILIKKIKNDNIIN